eukprot:TRINITY_DN476_c0_g1_i1.p1 TRINITY_DN476_c0_g1~~TRINITY_DN476_c0_g1_i1.p1  ORF type:complete len:752 (-),score=157.10 TRINITY_DN476_c0_g1_i1:426-2564(-)
MATCIEQLVEKSLSGENENCSENAVTVQPWTSSVEIVPNRNMPFKYNVQDTVWIGMNDGVNLAARVWQPEVNVPVTAIVEINPYRRMDNTLEVDSLTYPYLAGSGFACVRVDVRGCGDSEGHLDDEYSSRGIMDGHEIVEWVSKQSWCNGSVVLMGVSWSGFTALQVAAKENPPSALKAIIVAVTTDDRFEDDMHYMGGALLTENLSWGSWLLHTVSQPPITASPNNSSWINRWKERLQQLEPYHIKWMQHSTKDDYWKHGSISEDYSQLKVPVFAAGGYYCGGYSNSLARLANSLGSTQCRTLLGPWSHNFPHLTPLGPQYGYLQDVVNFVYSTVVGKVEKQLPEKTAYSVFALQPCEGKPLPHAATNVPGVWLSFKNHELATKAAPEDTLYFTNQNSLSRAAASSLNGNAVTVGHNATSTVGLAAGRWFTFGNNDHMPTDQSVEDQNSTIFETMNLDEDMLILGAPSVNLIVHSGPSKGIIAARLCAVSPDGVSHRITYGLKNLKDVSVDNTLNIHMDYICYRLPVGYKLRVSLSREYWPIAWSTDCDTPLQFSMESALNLQWTQFLADEIVSAMEDGKSLPPATVHLPEPPSTTERLENGHNNRKIKQLSDGGVEIVETDDRGCKVFTYEDGQKLSLSSKCVEKFVKKNKDTAHNVDWSTVQKFDGQNAEARLETSMEQSQGGSQVLHSCLSALHNGQIIFEKKWKHVL